MTSQRHIKIEFESLSASLTGPLEFVGDPEKRREFQAYADAVLPQLERAVLDLISQTAAAINGAGIGQELRLEYRDGAFYITIVASPDPDEATMDFDDRDWHRVTLRLPSQLKQAIDEDAGRRGVSANTWYVSQLWRATRHSARRGIPGGVVAANTARPGRRRRGRGHVGD